MTKKVIYIRVIKNPHDWLRDSKVRKLNGQESELVGYIGYNYSVNDTFAFFTSTTAYMQQLQSTVLKENVIHVCDSDSKEVKPITNQNATLNEILHIFKIQKKKVSPNSWNIIYKNETFENLSLEMIWDKLRELKLITW